MATNPAMIRVFERLGFVQEGCLRRHDALREGGYCDHIWLACFPEEFTCAQIEGQSTRKD